MPKRYKPREERIADWGLLVTSAILAGLVVATLAGYWALKF